MGGIRGNMGMSSDRKVEVKIEYQKRGRLLLESLKVVKGLMETGKIRQNFKNLGEEMNVNVIKGAYYFWKALNW